MYACSENFMTESNLPMVGCAWQRQVHLCYADAHIQKIHFFYGNGREKDSPPSSLHRRCNSISIKCKMFWDFFHWAPMHRKQKERVLSKQKQNKKEIEGPKGATRGGEWEPIKISCKRKLRLSPKAHTQPKRPRHSME